MKLTTIKRDIRPEDVGGKALFPYYKTDTEYFGKVKNNLVSLIDIKQPRNIKLFKKYWALCNLIAENIENFQGSEAVSDYMKMKTGLVDFREVVDGVVRIKCKSIAWENMDTEKFEEYWNKFIPIACELLECTEQEIIDNLVF